MKNQKLNLKIHLQKTIQSIFDYWSEVEFNIFRVGNLAKFGVLFCSGFLFLIFMHRMLEPDIWKWYWKLLSAYFLPPAGKESIIPLGLYKGIPPGIWFVTIWVWDILLATMVLTNWWLIEIVLKYFKKFNRWTTKLQKKTQSIKEKKYGKLLSVVLLLFMLVPLHGSGAISTAIIGSWLGFRVRDILIIVLIGSFISIYIIVLTYAKVTS